MSPRKIHDSITAFLFLLPGLIVLGVWLVYPMASALFISFHDWNIMPDAVSPFVGLENYLHALHDGFFLMALKNTGIFALVTVIGQLIMGLLVALMIDKIVHGRVIFRTLYYLPVVTSTVVASLLFKYLFNSSSAGIVNFALIDIFHVIKEPISWLTEANTAFVAIDSFAVWKGIGFSMIIFLAALQSIPEEIYQAASIDGAKEWDSFWAITLPLILPTILMVSIMLTIGAFQSYIPVALMTKGGPLHRTELVLSYMYGTAFDNLKFGYASAMAYILAIIVFGVSRFQMRFIKSSALNG
jgi:multiple sugar transport system permease protein